ncbi:hypothetical protein HK097_003427, partial [Rhizophlyctis rosea]
GWGEGRGELRVFERRMSPDNVSEGSDDGGEGKGNGVAEVVEGNEILGNAEIVEASSGSTYYLRSRQAAR